MSAPIATTPAAARDPPHKRETAAIPLVADRLLSHPGHRGGDDRPRDGVAAGRPVRSPRLCHAPLRTVVGAVHPLDERRAYRNAWTAAAAWRGQLRLRRE